MRTPYARRLIEKPGPGILPARLRKIIKEVEAQETASEFQEWADKITEHLAKEFKVSLDILERAFTAGVSVLHSAHRHACQGPRSGFKCRKLHYYAKAYRDDKWVNVRIIKYQPYRYSVQSWDSKRYVK